MIRAEIAKKRRRIVNGIAKVASLEPASLLGSSQIVRIVKGFFDTPIGESGLASG